MNIAVIGLGGVGAYYGYHINEACLNSGNSVTFVARGASYDAIERDGLTLVSSKGGMQRTRPNGLSKEVSRIAPPDIVFVCVKEYDLTNLCRELKRVVHDRTILIPLMNGVDIYERIKKELPDTCVLPACVYITSHIKEPGVVVQRGDFSLVVYGDNPSVAFDIESVHTLMEVSGVDYTYSRNVERAIWKKYMFIASFGLVTAAYNSSIGTVYVDEVQRKEVRMVMEEILAIAQKKEIELDDSTVDSSIEVAGKIVDDSPTSLQLDIHSGKGKSELDIFAGTIMRMGKEYAVDTPATARLYATIQSMSAILEK